MYILKSICHGTKSDMRMGTLSDSAIFKSMDMKYILFLILNDKSFGIKLLFVHNLSDNDQQRTSTTNSEQIPAQGKHKMMPLLKRAESPKPKRFRAGKPKFVLHM